MKLPLDENLSRRLASFLQNDFPGSTEVALVGLEQADDRTIWLHAQGHGYTIVTRDADFGELSSIHGAPPHVTWIRMANQGRAAVPPAPTAGQRGFTLIELAMVLFIVAMLLGGMLLPLAAQQDVRSFADTQKILSDARDALIGFAMANDRLPCPASATSNGQESFCDAAAGPCTVTLPLTVQTHGRCSNPYDGFFPAAALGMTPIDPQGYLLDGWGGDPVHRVRYSVSMATATAATYGFTAQSGMKTIGMNSLAPDLKVCSTGAGMVNPGTVSATCAAGAFLASDAVAVVYSLGKNATATTGGTSTDENHNPNPNSTLAADPAFVSAPQGESFDDQLMWLSKNTLFNRMVAAGRLP